MNETSCKLRSYHTNIRRIRQEKTRQQELPRKTRCLLLTEGHAVGALIDGGVGLMGAHQNAVQGAVVLVVTVVCTLLNGALNGLIGMTIHNENPPFIWVLP